MSRKTCNETLRYAQDEKGGFNLELKEKLLFVTKGGEDCDKGFTYILELAKTLDAGIAMLMVYSKKVMQTYEDVMAAVAFAEAGDRETVKQLMQAQENDIKEISDRKIAEMVERCRENSISFTYTVVADDAVSAIKDFLKTRPEVDMVLLSPNLSVSKKSIDLKKLLKNITKPIVTVSIPVRSEA
ncbi:MAG: hypothetical protein C4560_09035 [Nitrospiraceae bacterium]|nr:MAG: hypothetical protein C4560_09035 [Nitrospiraceae bacterium]